MSITRSHRPFARGFTLVELLVVIGIIALLVSILLPALGRARDSAITVQCASNMRQVGTAMLLFADENQGRFPRYAVRNGNDPEVPWNIVLSKHFQDIVVNIHPDDYQHFTKDFADRRTLNCPLMEMRQGVGFRRAWNMSFAAAGGQTNGAAPGAWGVELENPSQIDPEYQRYFLGAKVTSYRKSSDKFLVVESDGPRSYWRPQAPGNGPNDDGSVHLYLGNKNPWSSHDGRYTFRHSNKRRANFLFVDGHVASLSAQDEVNSWRRYNLMDNNLPEWEQPKP